MSKLNPMQFFSRSTGNGKPDSKGEGRIADAEQGKTQGSEDWKPVTPSYQPHLAHAEVPPHRVLSETEWWTLAQGLGAMSDKEKQKAVVPSRWPWAASSMPIGLYRDIVARRSKYGFLFQMTNTTRWTLMVLQLLIGAAITSLGATSAKGPVVTTLGAVNTVAAGLLALMHNSGLPERFSYDKMQFEELEDHVKEMLQVRIVPEGQTVDQALAECCDMFREAKATVAVNQPASYNSRKSLQDKIGATDKTKAPSGPTVPQTAPVQPTRGDAQPAPQSQAEPDEGPDDGQQEEPTGHDDEAVAVQAGKKGGDKCQLP
ncbi:hypothetical protein CDD81_1271 [Ophiocordyceps australis]|uniref:SMODS and SLOG-associating 2TM effector domain-containing protein n=1 Tax=Ophiocordyceps australis TaxID=1399860 RepID=A0A2C5YF38_9HYPO|nr:hypothetical protein CDD81_1271 [Ophiocordyceps australis]